MRILAGEFKGRRIHSPKGLVDVAASDRARETGFALLEPSKGLGVLDLFPGSGVMGLEALSRGVASRVLFVEPDRAAARAIHRNLDSLHLGFPQAQVLREAPIEALMSESLNARWDIVIVAPPSTVFAGLQPDLARHLHRVLWDLALVLVVTDADTKPQLPLPLTASSICDSVRLSLFSHNDLDAAEATDN